MQHANIYITVDPLWSYNFLAGLKEHMELDTTVMDTMYRMSCQYVHERHLFITTQGTSEGYNQALTALNNELHKYPIPQSYFLFYWECLYRALRVGLNTLHGFIRQLTPVCNDRGDVTGFVISIAHH